MTSIFYQNWLEKQHDSLLFNKAAFRYNEKALGKFNDILLAELEAANSGLV
ncbi:hypothetical protein [Symbiopectobacterium sp. RP]|uniref:hypothetical protein n=1 Tax=Symbiopectobacterium sp. RP TaxID=3248553 RepID=UPI003D265E3D